MQCYEFNDGCGITFGIIAQNEEDAKRYAASDCDEVVDDYKVRVIPDEEAKRREILDEDTGLRQTIYDILAEQIADGDISVGMLWHSEA